MVNSANFSATDTGALATEATLAAAKTVLDNIKATIDLINADIDATTSSRASETTLAAIKAKTDLMTFASGLLQVDDPALDVSLSTRASESTLAAIKTQTDKLTFSLGLLQVDDPANDVNRSTRASETTLAAIKAKTDLMTFASGLLQVDDPALDVNLSTRASEVTLASIDSALDVLLSSRASETTLSTLNGKLPTTAAMADAEANPTLSKLAVYLKAYNGATWDRVRLDAATGNLLTRMASWLGSTAPTVGQKTMASCLPVVIASDQSAVPISHANLDAALSSRASEATLAKMIPTQKTVQHNLAVTANTAFVSGLTPTNSPARFRITAAFTAATKFYLRITRSGNAQDVYLNDAAQLTATALYEFDVVVLSGDSIDLLTDTTTTCRVCRVIEVGAA